MLIAPENAEQQELSIIAAEEAKEFSHLPRQMVIF